MANTINNSCVAKAFAGILVIAAAVGAMASIVRPINQQLETLQYDFRQHCMENNHPWGVTAEIATLREKFVEVETQFKGLDKTVATLDRRLQLELHLEVKALRVELEWIKMELKRQDNSGGKIRRCQ